MRVNRGVTERETGETIMLAWEDRMLRHPEFISPSLSFRIFPIIDPRLARAEIIFEEKSYGRLEVGVKIQTCRGSAPCD